MEFCVLLRIKRHFRICVISANFNPMKSHMKFLLFIVLLIQFQKEAVAQWMLLPSGTQESLVDGSFIDTLTGVLVSRNGTMLRTSDAGNTWAISAQLGGECQAVAHVNGDTLFAGGDLLYRSTDAGRSWSYIADLPGTATDLAFFDGSHGYCICTSFDTCYWGGKQISLTHRMYETTNGGTQWNMIHYGLDGSSRLQRYAENSMVFLGGYHTNQHHCSGPWENTSRFTTDRGTTWSSIFQPWFGGSTI
jgi:photosystem II stability/assembly factor-like uncharacterized protein